MREISDKEGNEMSALQEKIIKPEDDAKMSDTANETDGIESETQKETATPNVESAKDAASSKESYSDPVTVESVPDETGTSYSPTLTLSESSSDTTQPTDRPETTIIIDPEFQGLFYDLNEEEHEKLKESILHDGCRDPLVVWKEKNVLIDGHNRYKICTEHGISYNTHELSFTDLDAVKVWMWKNQRGRRNMTKFQQAEIALLTFS